MADWADHCEAIVSGAAVVEVGAAVEAAAEAAVEAAGGGSPLRPLLGCGPDCTWPDSSSKLMLVSLWLSFMRLSSIVFSETGISISKARLACWAMDRLTDRQRSQ